MYYIIVILLLHNPIVFKNITNITNIIYPVNSCFLLPRMLTKKNFDLINDFNKYIVDILKIFTIFNQLNKFKPFSSAKSFFAVAMQNNIL